MDWVGVCVIACVTALGGGSMRDVLLGYYPLTWVHPPKYYLWITAIVILLTASAVSVMRRLRTVFLVLVSEIITGCAGGVLRDVLCNRVPLLFRKECMAACSWWPTRYS